MLFYKIEVLDFDSYNDLILKSLTPNFAILTIDDDEVESEFFDKFMQDSLESGLVWAGFSGKSAAKLETRLDVLITKGDNFHKFSDVETASYVDENVEEGVWCALNRIGLDSRYFDECKSLFILVKRNSELSDKIRMWISKPSVLNKIVGLKEP